MKTENEELSDAIFKLLKDAKKLLKTMDIKKELDLILHYLNTTYTQNSVWFEKSIEIPKEEVIYNCAIAYWDCGAVVIIKNIVYFITSEDLYWFIPDNSNLYFHYSYSNQVADALIRAKNLYEKINNK